ncbi:MAG: DinB family protein [Saprospiraceae bacterium]
MKSITIAIFSLLISSCLFAQTEKMKDSPLPYHEIPAAHDSYTAGSVAARTIDGLGYRYYWATEGINEDVLNYEPGNEGRKAADVLEHLFGLSDMIKNATLGEPNIRPLQNVPTDFADLRKATLNNLQAASEKLREAKDEDLNEMKIIFKRGEKESSFPFWNLLNGPIDDALTHVGQIVSYRRSAGVPQSPKVNVFMGKNRQQ